MNFKNNIKNRNTACYNCSWKWREKSESKDWGVVQTCDYFTFDLQVGYRSVELTGSLPL